MKCNRQFGRRLSLALALACAVPAAAQELQLPQDPNAPAAAGPATEAPATAVGQVVASVDGDPITQQEVQATLQPQLQAQPAGPQQIAMLQERVVNSLIESRLVEKYLREHGPEVQPQEIEQSIGALDQQLKSQQASMDQFLASRGYTPAMLEKRIAGSIAWHKVQQQHAADEAQLQQYYEANREYFEEADFEQAKGRVLNAYLGALYQGIVDQQKVQAEIQVAAPATAAIPSAAETSEPSAP